jgi:hypothetical protein
MNLRCASLVALPIISSLVYTTPIYSLPPSRSHPRQPARQADHGSDGRRLCRRPVIHEDQVDYDDSDPRNNGDELIQEQSLCSSQCLLHKLCKAEESADLQDVAMTARDKADQIIDEMFTGMLPDEIF